MKLKKKALEKAMTPHLEKLGYHPFKDNIFSLYAKKIQEGWYLMIDLTIARFYDDQFTVDLFLFVVDGVTVFEADTEGSVTTSISMHSISPFASPSSSPTPTK